MSHETFPRAIERLFYKAQRVAGNLRDERDAKHESCVFGATVFRSPLTPLNLLNLPIKTYNWLHFSPSFTRLLTYRHKMCGRRFFIIDDGVKTPATVRIQSISGDPWSSSTTVEEILSGGVWGTEMTRSSALVVYFNDRCWPKKLDFNK